MSLRGGDVAGRHNVGFYGNGEYIEIVHNANNKNVFIQGALKGAKWLSKKEKGLFCMQDCLNDGV